MKIFILLFIMLLSASSKLSAQNIEEWLIDSKQLPCKGNPSSKCFIIKKKGSDAWEYLDGDISGLIYYEGFVYYVQVIIEESKDIKSDVKSYSLLKIIERSKSTPQSLIAKDEIKTVKEIVPLDFILNGKTFGLSKMDNFVFNGDKNDPYIKFVHNRLDGSTGCNRFKCNFTIKEDNCRFSELMMTKMACLDKKAAIETQMRSYILSATTIEYKDNKIKLFDSKKLVLLEFIAKN